MEGEDMQIKMEGNRKPTSERKDKCNEWKGIERNGMERQGKARTRRTEREGNEWKGRTGCK